jgi:hypothetical protein
MLALILSRGGSVKSKLQKGNCWSLTAGRRRHDNPKLACRAFCNQSRSQRAEHYRVFLMPHGLSDALKKEKHGELRIV